MRFSRILSAEISNPEKSQLKISIDGDDYALIGFDLDRREVLIEGVSARYRIRSEDVEFIIPFEWTNYLGVEIKCRVDDDVDLHFVAARTSLLLETIRQLPFLLFLKRYIPLELYKSFIAALGMHHCETSV